jgi:hypothetical protein
LAVIDQYSGTNTANIKIQLKKMKAQLENSQEEVTTGVQRVTSSQLGQIMPKTPFYIYIYIYIYIYTYELHPKINDTFLGAELSRSVSARWGPRLKQIHLPDMGHIPLTSETTGLEFKPLLENEV